MGIIDSIDNIALQLRTYADECEQAAFLVGRIVRDPEKNYSLRTKFGINCRTGRLFISYLFKIKYDLLQRKLTNEDAEEWLGFAIDWLKAEFFMTILGDKEQEPEAFGKILDCTGPGINLPEEYLRDLTHRFRNIAENTALQFAQQKACLIGDMVGSQGVYKDRKGTGAKAESSIIETYIKRIIEAKYCGISQYYEGDKFVCILGDLHAAISAAEEMQRYFKKELETSFKIAVEKPGEVILLSGLPLKEVSEALITASRVLSAGKELTREKPEAKIFVEEKTRDALLRSGRAEHKDFIFLNEMDLGKDKGKFKIWELRLEETRGSG